MPLTMEIDPATRLIIRRVIGRITMDDIEQANMGTSRHPGFHPGMDAIWDLRQADIDHFSTVDLKKLSVFIARQTAWRGKNFKLALVASKEIDVIVSNTFRIIGQIEGLPIHIRIFKNFQKAVQWGRSVSNGAGRRRREANTASSQ